MYLIILLIIYNYCNCYEIKKVPLCKDCIHFRLINKLSNNIGICKLGLNIYSEPGKIEFKTADYMRNGNDKNYNCGKEGFFYKSKDIKNIS